MGVIQIAIPIEKHDFESEIERRQLKAGALNSR